MNSLVAQVRPSVTTPVEALQGPSNVSYIVVCNTDAGAALLSVYLSRRTASPTYDQENAIKWQETLATKATVFIEFPSPISMKDAKVRLAVQSSVASALTFSVFGDE